MQHPNRTLVAVGVLALAIGMLNALRPAHSQTDSALPAGEHLQIISTLLPSGIQQVLIVDTAVQSLAIYHVEPVNGKVQLKSVRRFAWDLQMEQFNGQVPLPSELREMRPAESGR